MISRLSANCVFTYVILYWWLTQESPTTIYTYTYWQFNDWLYIRYQIDNRVASTLFQNWIFFQMKKKKQFSFALFYSMSVNSWKKLIIQFQFFIARRRNKASTQRQLVCDAIFRTTYMPIQNVTFCDKTIWMMGNPRYLVLFFYIVWYEFQRNLNLLFHYS